MWLSAPLLSAAFSASFHSTAFSPPEFLPKRVGDDVM
jgi:hypothetical protein